MFSWTSKCITLLTAYLACDVASGFAVPTIQSSKRYLLVNANAHFLSPRIHHDKRKDKSLLASFDDEYEEDDDDAIDLADKDWRAFRAKLVMGEPSQEDEQQKSDKATNRTGVSPLRDSGDLDGIGALFADEDSGKRTGTTQLLTPLDPSQWAYDSGKVIEQGAVILGGVEQDYGFGLRQQYFHKAAILVLDHEESTFTKGIILNRPTDIRLQDDVNEGVTWKVWFGGDVQGIASSTPEYVCLHTITDPLVSKASVPVMNDIQWTTFDTAKTLVKRGLAKADDFWLFSGYAGWGPSQLMGELERKSWYMVATDAQTLLKELQRLTGGADPRDAGLDTWSLLMNMIGRDDVAKKSNGGFDDLMLKEWAYKSLLSPKTKRNFMSIPDWFPQKQKDITIGSLVRASPEPRSPFLLDSQELHKSIVLILRDDETMTTGVILNMPGAKPLEIRVKEDGKAKEIQLPLRFGGPYAIKGEDPLLWLHCNNLLKATNIGEPIGPSPDGIWKCSSNDMASALAQGLATIEDFLIVTGVSIWTKDANEVIKGMEGEVKNGHFEPIEPHKTLLIWEELKQQSILSPENLVQNIQLATNAWRTAGGDNSSDEASSNSSPVLTSGIGENFKGDDDALVFRTDKKVSELADEALRSWVATFLLGNPSLGSTDG